jgi:colanic acid/amylovoran biosynthesis glycosyltransferase
MKKIGVIICLFTSLIFGNPPLKVLFVTDKFPYQPRQYIDNQIAGFIDAGVDVRILASKGSFYENYALAEKYKFRDITFYKELPEDQRSYDIIYCQFASYGAKMLKMKKEGLVQGAVVACVRSGCEIEKIQKNSQKYETFFTDVDLLLPVCEAFKNHLIDLGCPTEKIMVHHSAIDVHQFKYKKRTIKQDNVKIVTVGRLIERKGHKFIIEAVENLKVKYPTIICDIYGDGKLHQKLMDIIQDNDLENNVFLKGYCNHDILQTVLDEYNLFVLASYTRGLNKEGIPNVLMESMAMGLPAIGTYHSGIPELIEDAVSGFLVPEEDSIVLAKKIDYVINHPELLEPLGKAARKKVIKEHCREKQNKKLLKIFNTLIQ